MLKYFEILAIYKSLCKNDQKQKVQKLVNFIGNPSQNLYLCHPPLFELADGIYLMKLKASAHSFKRFTSRLLKLSLSLSLCTYIPRVDVMLDFICMGPVDLSGARRSQQNTKRKTRTYNRQIRSLMFYRLS